MQVRDRNEHRRQGTPWVVVCADVRRHCAHFNQIKDYFFKSRTFEETFVGWAETHASVIDLSTTENKLECGSAHLIEYLRA